MLLNYMDSYMVLANNTRKHHHTHIEGGHRVPVVC